MLPLSTVPVSLVDVLQIVRSCFTAPTFATLCSLVTGVLAADGPRTVTGIWSAAGLAGRCHWSRGHRFFSRAVWDLDAVGSALARAVVECFVPEGGAVTVAVDDSLFHRYGKKVFGAAWQHDGSARGRDGIGRGNCFVILGVVVTLPFLTRQICLPVLLRLHIPKVSASKTAQARELVDLLAAALPGRRVHVVGDALYRGPAWRGLPRNITFTTRLASNAVLYGPEPPRTGKRGHPRWKGERLGTPVELAATATWRTVTIEIYGEVKTVQVFDLVCLWWGSLHRTPVRVVLLRFADSPRAYDWALVSTDTTAGAEEIVRRYGARWSIEQSIKDGKNLLGAGEARSRTRQAVERTVPFQLACQTVLVLWYARVGNAPGDVRARRVAAPWYRRKQHVSLEDMIIAFRRARITDVTAGQDASHQFAATTDASQPTAA
jgi:hypothetical protein